MTQALHKVSDLLMDITPLEETAIRELYDITSQKRRWIYEQYSN